jgi:hypothetical protein
MAKATTAKAPKKGKKTPKSDARSVAKTKPDTKARGGKSRAKDAADALWKLAEHPLVGELLAIGATAAVAAIAEGSGKGKKKASSKAVKAAGKAAAAAIGARLISEFAEGATKKAAKPAKA